MSNERRDCETRIALYDALRVLQTMRELQKDITMIVIKTDQLIIDVEKLDQKVDQVSDELTWVKGLAVSAFFLIPICAGFVWFGVNN